MNTDSKPSFVIRASHLGPILSLKEGKLSSKDQNLIFARNGTGKSFLARAFRYLDLLGQKEEVSEASLSLVSEESENGKGEFSFSHGSKTLADLTLEKIGDNTNANISATIFHVFSEDFVQRELRQYRFEMQDDIVNEIALGGENIQILTKQRELNEITTTRDKKYRSLQQKFESEKTSQLAGKAKIRGNLAKYRKTDFDESLLEQFPDKPDPLEIDFKAILSDLNNLKAIPAESVHPESVSTVEEEDISLDALEKCLQKVTSPSSVSDKIKGKINSHLEFYKIGAQIIQEEHPSECPFCEQSITNPNPEKVIQAYVSYFTDEEERHKSELRKFRQQFEQKETSLKEVKTLIVEQKSRYDNLKQYVPSKKSVSISSADDIFKTTHAEISTIVELIDQKIKALSTMHSMPDCKLFEHIKSINHVIEKNNAELYPLIEIIENNDDERREIQGRACDVFKHEFVIANWCDIEDLKTLKQEIQSKQAELATLQKEGPSQRARDRVMDTFHILLERFFADKYVFDKQKFILKRGDRKMRRGAHRTLSDGEKTAIAFCWFIARIHCKVKANDDYSKVFLVFDDPVTSMSYDFVFSIVQILKDLNISEVGEISVRQADIDGNRNKRPRLLILTHSSYFLNISRTNGVVKEEAIFSLYQDGETHKIDNLRRYIAPFNEHLRHVFKVSEGDKKPDHNTGNAVRSVLEAVGHFCRPDKLEKFQHFINFLTKDERIPIKSTLINSMCHGTYYEEIPTPEDLKCACEATVAVVKHFAPGQLEIIKDDKQK